MFIIQQNYVEIKKSARLNTSQNSFKFWHCVGILLPQIKLVLFSLVVHFSRDKLRNKNNL